MSQHDYEIANGTGSSVRSDLNELFIAISENNSGTSDPTYTAQHMWYADTGDSTLYKRNGNNNGWVAVSAVGGIDSPNLGLAPIAAPTFTGDVVFNSTGAVQVPSGTDAQRPGSPTNGDFRYNTDQNKFEGRVNGSWSDIGGGGGATGGDSGANAVFWENELTVTHDYSITAARGAGSFGDVTIAAGKTVTIPADSSWTIV